MLFFEDFWCGFPYEVYPTPAKGKDGGYIVYARPPSTAALALGQLMPIDRMVS